MFFRVDATDLEEKERYLVWRTLQDTKKAAEDAFLTSEFARNRLNASDDPRIPFVAPPQPPRPSPTHRKALPDPGDSRPTALRPPPMVVFDLEAEGPQPTSTTPFTAPSFAPAALPSSAPSVTVVPALPSAPDDHSTSTPPPATPPASSSTTTPSPAGTRVPVVVPPTALPSSYSQAWREMAKEATEDVQAPPPPPPPPAKKQRKAQIALPGPRVKYVPRGRNSKGQFVAKTPAPPPPTIRKPEDEEAAVMVVSFNPPRPLPHKKDMAKKLASAAATVKKSRVGKKTPDGCLIVEDDDENGTLCVINPTSSDEEAFRDSDSSSSSSSESDGDFEP